MPEHHVAMVCAMVCDTFDLTVEPDAGLQPTACHPFGAMLPKVTALP